MTVSYQYEVASSTSGGFTRLLFMWRGSLYKLIYRELALFLFVFGLISAIYRNFLTPDQKRLFEKLSTYCDSIINMIPLSFVLGFYVAYIATRWWSQFMAIPWPDKIMHSLALYVGGTDEHSRILRRTLMRYLNLSLVLVLRSISSAVKRRFPTLDHLVEAGFMTPAELVMFTSVPNLEFNTYWIPCAWFVNLMKDSRNNKMITDVQGLKFIMEEFSDFRAKCGLLWSYDWISIPLVYTQVVTLATYSYFIISVVGRQYTDSSNNTHQIEVDIYIPVFTILQFLFYMGLLKVAEQLINPFGDDDEDFELNWLIDRHTKVSYLGVDSLTIKSPPLVRDKYFNDFNLTLPYTGAAFAYKKKTYRGSVHNMQVPEEQQTMFLPEIMEEEEDKNPPRTPKNSYPSLQLSTPSPSAGTWRKSVCSTEGDNLSTAEEGGLSNTSTPDVRQEPNKMMRFFFPGKSRQSPASGQDHPTTKETTKDTTKATTEENGRFSSSELKQWSSNSTVDSFCSTVGTLDSTTGGDDAKKSPAFRRSSGNQPGHWKGVRWKPVLNDSGGDVWSDNATLRPTMSSVVLVLDGPDVEDDQPSLPFRRNTSPTADLQQQTVRVCKLGKVPAKSLPNLRHQAEFRLANLQNEETGTVESNNEQDS
ncbi:Bestrophin, RFP-TM, chloride channel [Nesidiocoris tenuis]|uniref:Bestrophin homolog n=2 Tax=Nesidiocoris tenuis TaxID=355587 RepID=A0ABN7AKQ1_9HEMI|nr:Bestrophin, RFP-TM, chloride channel [Nesidiocoris tenuis]